MAEHAWSLEAGAAPAARGVPGVGGGAAPGGGALLATPAPLHLRLAKLYEHRLHDYELARRHAALCAPAEEAVSHAKRHQRLMTVSSRNARVSNGDADLLAPLTTAR